MQSAKAENDGVKREYNEAWAVFKSKICKLNNGLNQNILTQMHSLQQVQIQLTIMPNNKNLITTS